MQVIAFTDEGTFLATLNNDDSITLGEELVTLDEFVEQEGSDERTEE